LDLLPAKVLWDSPAAFANDAQRKTLELAASKLHASKVLARASDVLAVLKRYEDWAPLKNGWTGSSAL
jgi:hypothetical protein